MPDSELILALLSSYERAVPGVDLDELAILGYTKEATGQAVDYLRENDLMTVKVVRDVAGRPYAGALIGLTDLGAALLRAMRRQPVPAAPALRQANNEKIRRLPPTPTELLV